MTAQDYHSDANARINGRLPVDWVHAIKTTRIVTISIVTESIIDWEKQHIFYYIQQF